MGESDKPRRPQIARVGVDGIAARRAFAQMVEGKRPRPSTMVRVGWHMIRFPTYLAWRHV